MAPNSLARADLADTPTAAGLPANAKAANTTERRRRGSVAASDAEPIDILTLSRRLSKSAVPATFVAPSEEGGQRISELLARFSQPQGLDLHVIAQHQLLGVLREVDLLVDRWKWTATDEKQRSGRAMSLAAYPLLFVAYIHTPKWELLDRAGLS